jgi:hypothetical protein
MTIEYLDLEKARTEVWSRWNDIKLKEKVKNFLGGDIPEPFREMPRAAFERNVISPTHEYNRFVELAKQVNLKPLGVEYLSDKFVTGNPDKLGLAKMTFFHRNNKKGAPIITHRTIVECSCYDGKKFSEIKTSWQESLIDFHHGLLKFNSSPVEVFDLSSWYKTHGGNANGYYVQLLSLFVCYGILFENFVTNEEEERFCHSVVYPAFKKVSGFFGMSPLIVPLIPHNEASDIYWRCYPVEMEKEVIRCLSECNAKDSSEHHHAGRCDGKESSHYGSKRDKE